MRIFKKFGLDGELNFIVYLYGNGSLKSRFFIHGLEIDRKSTKNFYEKGFNGEYIGFNNRNRKYTYYKINNNILENYPDVVVR